MGLKNTIDAFIKNLKSLRNPRFLRWAQQYLIMLGLLLALGLLLVILLPIIIPSFQGRDFSGAIQALSIMLMFIAMYSALIAFARINIRSRSEQDEERVREIDLKLKILKFNMNHVASQDEERILSQEYDRLELEQSFLISKSPRGWEQEVSTAWGRTLVASRNRLLDEGERLQARNRANLSYGVFAAGAGVIFFMVVGVTTYFNGDLITLYSGKFPFYYLLSLPISIISEFLAFFFLRLYVLTEQSIERNKNEITNIELRLTASQLLYDEKDEVNFFKLADTLSKEERNFVLKKNESSATSETLDNGKLLEIISKLALKIGT